MEIATTPPRTTKSMTDQMTTCSDEISTTDTQKKDDATSLADDLTLSTPREDSLNIKFSKEKKRKRLIIGVVISGAVFVIFVMVLLYTVFLYIKYKHNKTGTYIYGRQKKSWKSFQDSLNKKMNLQLRVSTPASGMSGLTLTML